MRTREKFTLLAFLVVTLGLTACATLRPIEISERPLEDKDLALDWSKAVNQEKDDFSEQVRLEAILDDGGRLSIRLLVSNLSTLDGRAELATRLTLGDGRVFSNTIQKDRGEWSTTGDRLEATVGTNTLSVRVGGASAHIEGDGFILDLEVETANRALRPRGGGLDVGGAYYRTSIPIPRGVFRGRLVFKDAPRPETEKVEIGTDASGELEEAEAPVPSGVLHEGEENDAEIDLDGVAYVEHRATDLAPYRMAKRWFKLKEFTSERTVIVSIFERMLELGGDVQGFALIVDDEGLRVYEPELVVTSKTLQTDTETGYTSRALLFLIGVDDPSFEAVIRPRELTERRDDLSKLKKLERVVVKRFMKPWTFVYEGSDYLFRRIPKKGEPETPPKEDEDARVETPEYESWAGRARFEIQQLNPD